MKLYTRFCSVLLALVFFVTSCTKTRDLPALSKSQLLSYKIPAAAGELTGVVDQSDKTITVYLPYFYQFDVIDPVITLSAGAKLSEESMPVAITEQGKTYTVIGADNSREVYTLTIHLQLGTPLSLREFSSATDTAQWVIGGNMYTVTGNYNTTDATKVALFVVDAAGKEYPMNANTGYGPASISTGVIGNDKVYSMGYVQTPQNVQPGLYNLRAKVQGQVATTQFPIRFTWGLPVFIYTPVTIKTGETFTLESSNAALNDIREVSFTVNGVKKPLEIVSYDYRKVTARVPSDVPPGSYIPTVTVGTLGTASPFWTITIAQ